MNLSPRLVRLVGALLFLAPAVNLVWRGGSGYCFFLLVAISLYVAFANRHSREYFAPLRKYPWYTASMLVFMVAIALQQAIEHYWLPRQFDALSRFTLALPLFLMLCRMSPRHLRAIGWGCVAGALAVAVWAIVARPPGGWTDATRLNNSYTNAIPFGDTALLLAFLSIFTFGWDPRRDWRTLSVKLLALVAGGFVSYLSGTRGGWLAVPVFVVLLGAQYGWFAHWKRLTVATAVVVVCAAALLSTERMQHRLDEATTDVTLMQRGNDDTSVGLRLQLWQASLRIFSQHPVYGVGKGRLVDALGEMAKRGEVKSEIVNERAHSDFFSTLAEMGTVGVLCLALYYFGTLVYFWRHRLAADPTIRTAAHAGLAVSFSTIIFGLTIDVLVPVMVTVLLALLTATLLAMIEVRGREIASVG